MEELIDPALCAYTAELPSNRISYVIGAGSGATFSSVLRQSGFAQAHTVQRRLLRAFVKTDASDNPTDKTLQNTLETLIGLTAACQLKIVKKAILPATPLRNGRQREFCAFCGNQSEYFAISTGFKEIDFHPENPIGKSKTLRLSSGYCDQHRPKLHNGIWNPAYQSAKRSTESFETELLRLTRQSGTLKFGKSQTKDHLLDIYFYLHALKHSFHSTDESILRHQARFFVDMKFTDHKKRILVLRKMGLSQPDIANRLGLKSRQAVSKALASIPSTLIQIPIPPDFAANFTR